MKFFNIINNGEYIKELFTALEKGNCIDREPLENGTKSIIISKEEAYKAVGDNQKLIDALKEIEDNKYVNCPCCGNITNHLFKDYRSSCDTVSSYVSCPICATFANEDYFKVRRMEKSNEEKFEYVLKNILEIEYEDKKENII